MGKLSLGDRGSFKDRDGGAPFGIHSRRYESAAPYGGPIKAPQSSDPATGNEKSLDVNDIENKIYEIINR